jgi:hypothetical protein
LITKTIKIIKRFMISIRLTAHTKDEAVGMAADDTTSVKEATLAMAITAMATVAMATATVAIATIVWATVAMATIAAITITVA